MLVTFKYKSYVLTQRVCWTNRNGYYVKHPRFNLNMLVFWSDVLKVVGV